MDEKAMKAMLDSIRNDLLQQMKANKKELRDEIKQSTIQIKEEVNEIKEKVDNNMGRNRRNENK